MILNLVLFELRYMKRTEMRCVLEGGKKKNILTLKHINNEIKGITH